MNGSLLGTDEVEVAVDVAKVLLVLVLVMLEVDSCDVPTEAVDDVP